MGDPLSPFLPVSLSSLSLNEFSHPEIDLRSPRVGWCLYPVCVVFFALSFSSLPILSDVF